MTLTVQYLEETFVKSETEAFRFGRDKTDDYPNDVGLNRDDLGISRFVGVIEHAGGSWRVTNVSTSQFLRVVDVASGREYVLPVATPRSKSTHELGGERIDIIVGGAIRRYVLKLSLPARLTENQPGDVLNTKSTQTLKPVLTERQLAVLIAMAEGYLLPHPRTERVPRTDLQIAERLHIGDKTVSKYVEEIKRVFTNAAITELDLLNARSTICQVAINLGRVDRNSITWLDHHVATWRTRG